MAKNLKDKDLMQLYDHYVADDIDAFRSYCTELIKRANAPNRSILENIPKMSKERLLQACNDFVMKGHGFGVV